MGPPVGAPPGTPPLRWGRPMADSCKPSFDAQGNYAGINMFKSESGKKWSDIYGEEGWCQKDKGMKAEDR